MIGKVAVRAEFSAIQIPDSIENFSLHPRRPRLSADVEGRLGAAGNVSVRPPIGSLGTDFLAAASGLLRNGRYSLVGPSSGSFLLDFAAHARFLIAVPLLIFAQRIVDGRLQDAAEVFISRGLIKEAEVPAYDATARGILRLRDSLLPDLLMLALAFLPLLIQPEPVFLTNMTTWRTVMAPAVNGRSVAGWWFDFVSLPLYRFILLRWMWWYPAMDILSLSHHAL